MDRSPHRVALDSTLGEVRKQRSACDPRLWTAVQPGTLAWAAAMARAAVWETIATVLEGTDAEPDAVRRALVALELHAAASDWDGRYIRETVLRRLERALGGKWTGR